MTAVVPADRTPFTRAPAPLTCNFGKVIERHPNGRKKKLAFFYAHAPHDYTHPFDNGPALIEYYEDGTVRSEHYYRDGNLHREDGPAVIRYSEQGEVLGEEWFIDGEWRYSDFSERTYFPGQVVHTEIWRTNHGTPNRRGGPARIEYRTNGSLLQEDYLRLGKRHRIDGPAHIVYEADGSSRWKLLHLDGEDYVDPAELLAALDTWTKDRLLSELTDVGMRRPPYDPWTDEEDLGPDPLDSLSAEELCAVIIAEHFPHLTTEGVSPNAIAAALRGGVSTDEGIREVHRGAPVEWVRSFEDSGKASLSESEC